MGRKARLRDQRKTTKQVEPPSRVRPAGPPLIERRAILIASIVLLVSIAIVFGRVRSQQFITLDDPDYVTANSHVATGVAADNVRWAFGTFHAGNWHPLTWISHMLDVQMFGLTPGAHKLVNVAFHAGAALLLLLFLFRTTGAVWPSAIVAALFALHPTRVESVVWVSERKDVLSALLFMLTLFLYAGYAQSGRRTRMIWVTVAFALALMAKPSAITLPFVLLLLDWWPLRRFEREKISQLVLEKVPLFVLVVGSVIVTLQAQTAAIVKLPLSTRIANAIVAYGDYLRLLVWPSHLAVFYPFHFTISAATTLFVTVVLIAITLVALFYARRWPFLIVGWLWYLGTMVPMSGLVKAGTQWIADRYTYLPFVGLFIAIVWVGAAVAVQRPALERVLAAIAIALTIAVGAASFVQAGYWKDSETLFTRATAVTKNNEVAHANLAMVLLERGNPREALPHIRTAVEIDPAIPYFQYTYGRVLDAVGDPAGAERALERAIELDPEFPNAYRSLADLKMKMGRQSEAVALLEKANSMSDNPAARAALAAAKGDVNGAITDYEAALRQSPNDADLHNDYATILARSQRDQEALNEYREALRLSPGHFQATMNIGALLRRMGRNAEAVDRLRKASLLRPTAPEPHVYLALIHFVDGDIARALNEIDLATRLDPAQSNRIFTEIMRIPFKETNLAQFRAALEARNTKKS